MQPRLVELEERLARDADGSARAAIVAELSGVRQALQWRIARGASPVQYSRWSAAERAVSAALAVLATIKVEPTSEKIDGPAVNLKGE